MGSQQLATCRLAPAEPGLSQASVTLHVHPCINCALHSQPAAGSDTAKLSSHVRLQLVMSYWSCGCAHATDLDNSEASLDSLVMAFDEATTAQQCRHDAFRVACSAASKKRTVCPANTVHVSFQLR